MLDFRGGRGGTGVDPAMDRDGEGTGTGMAGFVLEMLFVRFMNGFGFLVGEVDARVVVSGIEPSSLERVDPLRVGLALLGAEVARLAKGLFELKPGVDGGSLVADETETRSVWIVLGVFGADRFGGSGGGGERRRVSCAENPKSHEQKSKLLRTSMTYVVWNSKTSEGSAETFWASSLLRKRKKHYQSRMIRDSG